MNFDPFADLSTESPVFSNNTSEEVVPRDRALGGTTYETTTNKTLSWKSSTKCFNCYDSQTKETTAVKPETEFIPLVRSMCIVGNRQLGKKGTPSEHWSRIYSNEFLNTSEDLVVVREKDSYEDTNTIIAEGTYSEVKEVTGPLPYANFALNIYALIRGTDEVVRIQFSRSSREAGFDIVNNFRGKYFKLDGFKEQMNGNVSFNVPVIAYGDITSEEDQQANVIAQDIRAKLAKNQSSVKLSK